jgi:WD40 repeat protein
MNPKILQMTLVVLTSILITACGSSSSVLSEEEKAVEQKTATSPILTTTVVDEAEKVTKTPIPPTPTATAGNEATASPEIVTESATPEPPITTATPVVTNTPIAATGQSIIIVPQPPSSPTLILYPTSIPSPTPTPTFEPFSDKPIGGYIFSPPELILTHNYIEIVDWLPDSNEKLVIRNFEDDKFLVETLDIKTGQRQRLVETNRYIVGNPVILSANQQIAYLAQDGIGAINLHFNDLNTRETSTSALSGISPPIVPNRAETGILVFDTQMSRLLDTNQKARKTQNVLERTPLPIVEDGPFAHYRATWADKTDWIAYYNPEKFILINPQTGETRGVDLGKGPGDLGQLWVTYATWSPDGQKLALIVTAGTMFPPLNFTQLAIFNPSTNEVQLIEDNFVYVSDITWAPNSKQVLIKPNIGTYEGYSVHALFLVDILSNDITPVPVMPKNALGGAYNGLAWSPDGTEIVVRYAENPGEVGWYRVSVAKP